MDFKELEKQVKELIARDEIEACIRLLSDYFTGGEKLDDLILQSARYHSILKDQSSGTIDYEDIQKTLNQLRRNILSFLKSEEQNSRFRSRVFQSDQSEEDDSMIPVFFSVGTPHNDFQTDYIDKLKTHLLKYKVELKTLGNDDWDVLDPLHPIKRKMEECIGCLVLAMERYYVKVGVSKRGSKQESRINDQNYSTPWSHIEAALAYQLNLPFIVLKEDKIKREGMLDDTLFEWRIVKINPKNPDELDQYPVKSFIRMWIEELKQRRKLKRAK